MIPPEMKQFLDHRYAVMQAQASPPAPTVRIGGQTVGGAVTDPFTKLKPGEVKTAGNFSGQGYRDGVSVVRSSNAAPNPGLGAGAYAFDRYSSLGLKPAQATEAVRTVFGADTATTAANANAEAAAAAARVSNVRADLAPAESLAGNALTRANTGLVDQQAQYYGPNIQSEIGLRGAQARSATADIQPQEATSLERVKALLGPNWRDYLSLPGIR